MKRVAVLRGGPSEEYDVSLKTGLGVLQSLKNINYPHRDIIITKKGEWLENGIVQKPEQAIEAVDVVFLALHGAYGEDGQVQRILERKAVPFTGSRAMPSAIAFNKELTKQTLRPHGVTMARHRRVTRAEWPLEEEALDDIIAEVGADVFIKPIASGSSIGVRNVTHKEALRITIEELLKQYEQLLIEETIRGREATVGVISNFRDRDTYALPVVEIVPADGVPFFTYEGKYNGSTTELVPGRFSPSEKARMTELALAAHQHLGCKHYSRTDFMVKDGEVYFLEINTLPGLTSESLLPKAAAAVGLGYDDLVKHLIDTATI